MNSTDFYYYYDTSVRSAALAWYSKIFMLVLLFYAIFHYACNQRRNQESGTDHQEPLLPLPDTIATKSETCTICIDDFEEGERVIELPCKHAFHPKCITPWLKKSSECPNCKTKITARAVDP